MQCAIARNKDEVKALFPSHAKLVVCGAFSQMSKTTKKKMLYISNDFLSAMDDVVYSHDRGVAMSHLITLGLAYYIRHQPLQEIDLGQGLLGMTSAIAHRPLRATDVTINPPVVAISGRVARDGARGFNLTIPDDLYELCERYTSTSQSRRIASSSATAWICHLAARGLFIVKGQKGKKEILITDGFYGVRNFPNLNGASS